MRAIWGFWWREIQAREREKKNEIIIIRQETISIVYFCYFEIEFTIRKSCADFESSEQQIKALENKRNSFRAIRVNN